MSRLPRSAWCGLWLVAVFAGSVFAMGPIGLARAQPAEEPIRLDYQSGPGCPDEASFVTRIRARSQRARLVAEGEPAREFHVRLAGAGRPAGSVTVVNHGHADGTRRVDAATCDEVADGLSLIVALALDPRAPAAEAPPVASTPAGVSPVDAGAPSGPIVSPAAAPSVPAASAPPAPSAPSLPPPPPAPSRAPPTPPPSGAQGPAPAETTAHDAAAGRGPGPLGLHLFAGLDFAAATAVAPVDLFGASPYLGWRSTGAALLGLSIRAAFLRIGSGPQTAPGGKATFTWTVGRVDACGLFRPDRPLRAGGCARVESGLLDGSGDDIVAARTQHGAWIAVGALARVEWTFLGPLLLDLEAGPTFRPVYDRFRFLPDTTVYQVPVVGFDAEAGLGVHFL